MIEASKLIVIVIPTLCNNFQIEAPQSRYSMHIPYSDLYIIEEKPNKDTLNYNTMSMEELIKSQNEEIMKKIMEDPGNTKGF